MDKGGTVPAGSLPPVVEGGEDSSPPPPGTADVAYPLSSVSSACVPPTKLYIHFTSATPFHGELHEYFAQFFANGKSPTVRMSHDRASAFLNANGDTDAVRRILDVSHPGMIVKIDRAALTRGRRIFVTFDKDFGGVKRGALDQKTSLDELRKYFEQFGTVVFFAFENLRNNALLEMSSAEENDAVLNFTNHKPWMHVKPDAIRRAVSAGVQGATAPIDPFISVTPAGPEGNNSPPVDIAPRGRPPFTADVIAELLAMRRKYVDELMQLDNRIREAYANSHFFRGGFPDDFNPNYT